MQSALIVAQQVLMIFILMGIGILIKKKEIITIEATRMISNLMMVVVMPALIINSLIQPLDPQQLLGFAIVAVLAVAYHLISIPLASLLIPKREDLNYRVERMSAIYPNCGFMAIPLITATIGAENIFYVTAFIAVFTFFTWTNGVKTLTGGGKTSPRVLLFNPGIISLVAGFLLYFTQLPVPSVAKEVLEYVSGMNTPLAMIVAGIYLADLNPLRVVKNWKAYRATLLKLLLFPMILLVIMVVIRLPHWFPGAQDVMLTTMFAAACPTAATSILMTSKMGLNGERGAEIVAMSTLLSIVTMPLFTFLSTLFF